MTSTHPAAIEAALRAACADLERRLRAGESARAEDAFAAHPTLAAHTEAAVDLIYAEYATRAECGQQALAEEFYARFPRWREYLRQQFEAEAILRDRAADSLSIPAPTAAPAGERTPAAAVGWPRRYELLGEVGHGGMGVVYKARQTSLNRVVALKVLRWASDGPELARLRVEAEAVARLQHPGVVQIFEVGEQDGQPYLALEYVAGGSLAAHLAGKPQPPRDAAALVAKLADAVHYAHTQGVVHRDLKPGNVLLGGDAASPPADVDASQNVAARYDFAAPKIADFGLARILDTDSRQTKTGTHLGTPSYMAPEQASGSTDVGPAADVWALGAILYECLTGRPPFAGPTPLETMDQVRTREPVPPSRLQAKVPRDLDTVCLKCLQKDPRGRYATARDLADDLGRFLADQPVKARPVGRLGRAGRWAKRRPAVAGLLLALATTLVGGVIGVFDQWRRAESLAAAMRDERDAVARERDRAEANDGRARAVLRQLAEFGGSLADQPRVDATRQKVLEAVLGFYQSLLDERAADPKIRRETAKAAQQVALLHTQLKRFDRAEAGWKQCVGLYEALVADFPGELEYVHELALSLKFRANLRRDRRLDAESDADYRRAVELFESLAAADPQSFRHHAAVANAMVNWAVALKALARFDDMERLYLRAVDLLERAVAADPHSAPLRNELALARDDFGALLRSRGRPSQGTALMRAAFEERQRLYAADPQSRSVRVLLARSHHHLGEAHAADGQLAEAEAHLRQAVAMREQIAKDFASVPHYHHEHALSLIELARTLRDAPRWAERLAVDGQVVAAYRKLCADYPENVEYRRRLVVGHADAALVLGRLGRTAEAVDSLRAALRLAPDDAAANRQLAWLLATAADDRWRDPAEAVALARRAVAAAPAVADHRMTLGVALYRAGHDAEAVSELERSAAGRTADDPYDWLYLALAYRRRGDAAKARGCLERGVRALEKSDAPDDDLRRLRAEAEAAQGR